MSECETDLMTAKIRVGPQYKCIAVTNFNGKPTVRLIKATGGGQILTADDLEQSPQEKARWLRDWMQGWIDHIEQQRA